MVPIENVFPYEASAGANFVNKSQPSYREAINTGRVTLTELSN